jgi:hypothetical protein
VTKRRSDVPVFLLYAGIIHAIGLALLLPMLISLPGPGREPAAVPETPQVGVVVLPPPQPLADVGPDQTSALPSAAPVADGKAKEATPPAAAEPKIEQEPRDENAARAGAAEPDAKPAPQQTDPAQAAPHPTLEGAKDSVAHAGPESEAQPEAGPEVPPADVEPQGQARDADAPAKPKTEAQETTPTKPSVDAKDALPAKAAPRTARKSSVRRNTAKAGSGRKASRTAKSQTKFAPLNGMLSGLLSPPPKKRR